MTTLMGADLNNIVKCQVLSDEHVQFLVYQLLRGLKVGAEGGLGQAGGPWAGRPAVPGQEPDHSLPSRSTSTRRGSSTG